MKIVAELHLNAYQATNLEWCCAQIMDKAEYNDLNTGDWVGELRWALEQKRIDAAEYVDYAPNAMTYGERLALPGDSAA